MTRKLLHVAVPTTNLLFSIIPKMGEHQEPGVDTASPKSATEQPPDPNSSEPSPEPKGPPNGESWNTTPITRKRIRSGDEQSDEDEREAVR